MRIAVVGTGAAGIGAAWALAQRHDVTVFESDDRIGGHCNTVDVTLPDRSLAVDTGFIVYNERNYPNLTAWFRHLQVPTEASDMSFSVQACFDGIEWSGDSLATVFAQPGNLLRPRFVGMVAQILRFNRRATADLLAGRVGDISLGAYLAAGGFGWAFRDWYLLPMGAAIWSATADDMLAFPALAFLRFFHNHGLLTVDDRPQWRTVSGGSRSYVARAAAGLQGRILTGTPVLAVRRGQGGVEVVDGLGGRRWFDHAVLAAHADQSLAMLDDATPAERRLLGAFRYRRNRAVLHMDGSAMPRRRKAWASWNYRIEPGGAANAPASVTYWMNRLQNIDRRWPLFVTLNPQRAPRPAAVIADLTYDHPQFDAAAIAAQPGLDALQGAGGVWLCGSYCGHGFHEDAFTAGLRVAEALGAPPPWQRAGPPPLPRPAMPAYAMAAGG